MEEKPFTLRESAVALHEYYYNLRQAGFTRREALILTSCMVTNKPLDPNV